MDETIVLALLQDGLTTGAIYLLLAVGLRSPSPSRG